MRLRILRKLSVCAAAALLLLSSYSAHSAEVGIYDPEPEGGRAWGVGAIGSTLVEADIEVERFSRMSMENLLKYRAVIIPNTSILARGEDPRWRDNLRAYVVEAGGALIFCHDAIGAERSPFGQVPLFPEIAVPGSVEQSIYEEGQRMEGHSVRVVAHQESDAIVDVEFHYLPGYDFNQTVQHVYYDHFTFTQAAGTPLLINIETGKTVLGVGEAGKGRVVLNGMLLAAAGVEGIDRDAMLNTVRWALEGSGPVVADPSFMEIAEWRPDMPGFEIEAESRVAVIGVGTFDVRERAVEKISWVVENDFIPFNLLEYRDLTPGDYSLIVVYPPFWGSERDVSDEAVEKIIRYIDDGGRAMIYLPMMLKPGVIESRSDFLDLIGSEQTDATGFDNPHELRLLRWTDPDGAPRETNNAVPGNHMGIISEPRADGAKTVGYWYDREGERRHIAMVKAPFGYVLNINTIHDHRMFTAPAMADAAPELGPEIFEHMLIKYDDVKERVEAAVLSADGRGRHAGALRMERRAREAAAAGNFVAATRQLLEAENEMVKAYAVSMPSVRGETRNVFTWARTLPDPDIYLSRLARAGFTGATLTHLEGHYPSRIYREQTPGKDYLQKWIDAGRRHGIKIGVVIAPFFVFQGSDVYDRAVKENWLAVAARDYGKESGPISGSPWRIDDVCRSRPEIVDYAVDKSLELIENYQVDFIDLDYIRWRWTCYCDACREQFEEHMGFKIENWPDEVTSGTYAGEFDKWRAGPVTSVVRRTSELIGRINPEIKLSVWVFDERRARSLGQFWWEWTDYVDLIQPMVYGPDNSALENTMKEMNSLIPAGGRARLAPGLAPPGDKRGSDLTKLQQIDLQREHAPAGLAYFTYHYFSDYWLDLLSMGPWRER